MKIFFLLLFSILFKVGCNHDNISKEKKSTNNLIKNNYDLKIDSAFVNVFYKDNFISDSIQIETNKFYRRRNYKVAWFNKEGMNCAVSIFYNQLQNYQYNFSDSSFYNSDLDSLIIKSQSDELQFLSQKNEIQKLDLLLTTTFFRYAKKAYGGEAKKLSNLEWFIPRQNKNYQSTLDSLVLISKAENEQIPLSKGYFLLKYQLKKYRDIEKKGGFPIVLISKSKCSIGNSDSSLLLAKKCFYITGDLKNDDETIVFTDSLQNAIKRFQQRMGLVTNGSLDSKTIIELNKPVSYRIKQIMINMERLRWAPVDMEKEYLLINIPEFKLYLFENGKQIWTTNIIVGRSATQTTIFKGNISQIILNPYWEVPARIAKKEIVPHIKRDSIYLNKNNIKVFLENKIVNSSTIDWSQYKENIPFTFRQKPGKNNALGKIKFLFPNVYSIYLHDTPSKELFGDTKRAFSHGCIRVAEPQILALYLLKDNKDWNKIKIDKILQTNNETKIQIIPTIPIYIMYFTAWVDNNGQLNFRNDLYNLDSKLSKEIFGVQ
jgi:murein L,D-transpeptidase YcbB/YkuD